MFALVKTLSVGLCLLSVFSCIFMQPKDYLTAELSVAGDSSVTEITQVTEITKPTKKVTVVATAYCACESCCGKSDGITASGVKARANHTIAVDRNVFPLGTHILYNGTEYVAEDTGGAIKGNRIDIYFDNHSEALEWGRRTIEIEVIV
jgi:3D (Asp-Asp-Asp) domain-containing protein